MKNEKLPVRQSSDLDVNRDKTKTNKKNHIKHLLVFRYDPGRRLNCSRYLHGGRGTLGTRFFFFSFMTKCKTLKLIERIVEQNKIVTHPNDGYDPRNTTWTPLESCRCYSTGNGNGKDTSTDEWTDTSRPDCEPQSSALRGSPGGGGEGNKSTRTLRNIISRGPPRMSRGWRHSRFCF